MHCLRRRSQRSCRCDSATVITMVEHKAYNDEVSRDAYKSLLRSHSSHSFCTQESTNAPDSRGQPLTDWGYTQSDNIMCTYTEKIRYSCGHRTNATFVTWCPWKVLHVMARTNHPIPPCLPYGPWTFTSEKCADCKERDREHDRSERSGGNGGAANDGGTNE